MNLLRQEITDDPLGRGYASMTDAQVATSLNTISRTLIRSTLSSAEIYENIDPTEFQSKTEAQKQYIRDILGLGTDIQVGPTSKARAVMIGIFGPASNTITNLASILTVPISRAQELGIPPVREGDVQVARAQ